MKSVVAETLTDRQKEILSFIQEHMKKTSMSPTITEIQEHFRFASPKAVSDHLACLEKKKLIHRIPRKSRAIRVLGPTNAADSDYEAIFKPHSIAVIGASHREGTVGFSILSNILHGPFSGVVYPVNLNQESILGVRCYKSVLEIPDPVDLAVIIVRAAFVPDVIRECAKKKVKGAIIVSAGFKEVGPEGAKIEDEVKALAKKYKIALVGPNCLGVINTDPTIRLNASFSRNMPKAEPTAFISQSGALCTAILDYARAIADGFSKFISIGNKAGANEINMIEMLGKDPLTNVILMYVEDFVDAKRLIEVARNITGEQEFKKPILAIKSGRTAAGAKAASSHTGSLAGSDEVYDAIFSQSGILRVDSVSELFDLALAFGNQPLPAGRRVAIVTNAGGPGIMATDACIRYGLEMAQLSSGTMEKLKKSLPPASNVTNPVDVIGDAKSDRYRAAMEAVCDDPGVDAVIVILTPQAMTDIEEIARVISIYGRQKKKTIIATFMGIVDVSKGVSILGENHIPHYAFPESAAHVLARMAEYSQWIQRPRTEVKEFSVTVSKARSILSGLKRKTGQIPTPQVEQLLRLYGFPVLDSAYVDSEQKAVQEASKIGFPVALKVVSADIIHKVDVGGVKLGIKNPSQVGEAYQQMITDVAKTSPNAKIDSIWVQKMASKGREVILGMKRDPRFGPLIMFGLGGTYVEIFKDVTFRLAPLREYSAQRMVESIRTYPILKGVRGEKAADVAILIEMLERLSKLSVDLPQIQEIDINPLMVYEKGKGAHVVDARMIL